MSNWKLRLYHQVPPFVRNWIASARGYYLQSWRYTSQTDQLVEEAHNRESWSLEQWKDYQEERVAFVLERAAKQIPYYRDLWAERRRNGDKSSWEYIENWPILEKEPLRENPRAFVADDCDIKSMFHEYTSGTTGKSLDLWWSRTTVRAWYALFEARWRQWYGVTRYDRWGIIGGQLVTPVQQASPPFWVWNQGMRQLYLSSYHLAPQFLSDYLTALEKYKIQYIYAYTSAIYTLAQEVLRNDNVTVPQLKVIITNAEPLYDYQRETIEKAFNCPVRETYGMSEIVMAASECEHGNLHLWPEIGHIELAERDRILPDSANSGELICTSLLNTDMPLIRYRVGDRAQLSTKTDCACGRHLPRIERIEGRQDDMLYTPDGRRVGRLDPVFKSSLPVQEAQIIQDTLTDIRVLFVPDKDYTDADGQSIVDRLKERMGASIQVKLEAVQSIPRTSNGKFRSVICNLQPQEIEKLEIK